MADDGSDFARSMAIATSGLRAQAGRTQVISENIANADSTAQTSGGEPYRRKVPTFSSALDRALDARVVTLGKIRPDQSNFRVKYEPNNPAADASGNVKYPNVNSMVEMTDMRDAQRSYEANLNIISATRRMIQRTLDILKI
jgi:flagellar basal-body rod protein FlgC